jgi:hypothetical protein
VLPCDEVRLQLSISGKGGQVSYQTGCGRVLLAVSLSANDLERSFESSALDTLLRLDHHARWAS